MKKKLKFNKKKHTYKVGNTDLTSVTKFVHSFFKPFDAKAIARKLAKIPANKAAKKGVRYFLKEWKQSSEHGTTVHDGLEQYVNGKTFKDIAEGLEFDRDCNKLIQGISFLDLQKNVSKIAEMKVFDEELKLAGTLDLQLVKEVDGKKHVIICDWKTNKAIKQQAYRKKDKGTGVCSELPDSNYYHYALQLSTYAYMLERKGYVIDGLVLVHLLEDRFIPYEINYDDYKELIPKMVEEHNAKKEQERTGNGTDGEICKDNRGDGEAKTKEPTKESN